MEYGVFCLRQCLTADTGNSVGTDTWILDTNDSNEFKLQRQHLQLRKIYIWRCCSFRCNFWDRSEAIAQLGHFVVITKCLGENKLLG